MLYIIKVSYKRALFFSARLHYMFRVLSASAVLIVLLMMGAESTRNMYSNLAEKNKYDCLKLHRVGYLIKWIDDARNHKYKKIDTVVFVSSAVSVQFCIPQCYVIRSQFLSMLNTWF
jgi:hypothetical protein